MVILNNPHMLQYFITKTCDPVYFNGYQSLYKKATFQALNLEQQSGHGKELLLWNQISQKITVYNACQHIKKCADEIIHLMKSQNTESTHDNGTLKNFVSSHLFETLRNIECLQEQLLCVLALEHLDELYDGEQYFGQTTHVGLTIPYQQLSIVSFDLFSHFQVLDYLTVWMMVARCCQPHSAGSQLLAKCLTFISAQMLSRRGITYLTNIFLSKVSTTVVQCYHLCWPDELTIPENDLDNADATVTLMIIWEKLLENLPQNLSNDQILSEDHELQEKIYRSNSIHESYNSFWIGSDRTIQSLCKNIVHVTPTNFEIMDSIFACKSIGQASSNILLQLKSRMNAFLFSKEIYTAMNKQNTRSSNTYHAEDEIESKALKCLAAMSQSTSEQQEVARSVLELHLFPAILKGTLSTHNDTKQSAILVAEAIVESKHSLPWLMHEMNYAGVKDILALFPNLWRWVEVIDTYHNSGLTEAIECCSRNVISTVNSDVLLTDPTILRNLIACLQLCLWKTTLARFQGIAGHITGGQIPEIISSQCEGGDIAQLSLSQMATLMVITTKHLRTWMTRHSTTRPQIENRKMTFMNSARGSILEYGTRISRFSNRSDSRSSLQLLISLCDTLHLLSQLMRQACEALFKYSINPWNRTGPTDNCDSLAKLIANTAVDVLCIIDDLRTVLREASHDHHVTNIMSSIKRTKLEIITVFHLECSIVVKHNKTNGKDSSNAEVRYSSIGLSRYFGRYILDCSLKTILENPSSANTCLKIVEEVLPDNFQEEFENLDAVSQQLRIYWRDLVAGMIPNMLKLRFLVISNNQELSRSASIVLSKIIGVCCDSEEFIGKLKFELSKELNSHIAYAMYARKCEGTSRHIGLQMYQNEILIRRWLQFTGHIRCLRNIHIYFSSALEQAKLTIDEMKGFSEVQGNICTSYR